MLSNGHKIIFETQGETKQKVFKLANGVELLQGTQLIENQNKVRETEGIVIDAPKSTGLVAGDKIHFHLNTIQDNQRIDYVKHLYWCELDDIFYFERDGVVNMINDYILVDKMEQQEKDKVLPSGIIIPNTVVAKEYNIGFVKYSNNELVKVGDKIVYNRHIRDGLTLHLLGQDLLRFKKDRVCAIYQDDVIVPVNGYVLVNEVVEAKKGLIHYEEESKIMKAKIADTGQVVMYSKSEHTEIHDQFLVKYEDILVSLN